MRRYVPALVAMALVVAACAQPPSESVAGSTTEPPELSGATRETIGRACGRVADALQQGDTAMLVSSLEDIDAALSSSPDVAGFREYTVAAVDALPVFEDTPPSAEQLSNAAGPLIDLSNGLIAVGLESCAGIGEIAADLTGPVIVDPEAAASALAANRAMWEAEGPDTYWMEMSFGTDGGDRESQCAWGRTIVSQVVDGRAESAITKSPGCVVDIDDPDGVPLTVEELFSLVQDSPGIDMVEVEYNPVFGYPRMLFVGGSGFFYEVSVMSLTAGLADTSQADAVLTELATQREIWRSADISSYSMTVQIDCFCFEEYRGPFDVTVVDGVLETATWKGSPVSEMIDGSLLTVEGLLDRIEASVNADSISVVYAPLGYPTAITIDPSRNTADEELGVRVLRFVVDD